MQKSLRGYLITLLVVWTVLCIAATVYSQQKHIPFWVTIAVVPAFLVEAGLYIAAGLSGTRALLEKLPRTMLAACITTSAVVPYLIYSIPTGVFRAENAAAILVLAAIASFWFIFAGKSTVGDFAFLIVMGLPILLKVFPRFYPDPIPRLQLFVLGVMMWYRIGILATLSIRKMGGVGFGFIPRAKEWAVGLVCFVLFLPLGIGGGVYLEFLHLKPVSFSPSTLATAAATFVITLWFLATAEEIFFRGLLQQLLTKKLHSQIAGILMASIIFGACHLGKDQFPNWDFAMLATCAGVFYGIAYAQAKSVRAAMVTHALVNTTWRVFLF